VKGNETFEMKLFNSLTGCRDTKGLVCSDIRFQFLLRQFSVQRFGLRTLLKPTQYIPSIIEF